MSENSKQRKSIRTITPSLLLLFAIGCESTMVSPEYDDYDNSDTTYSEYFDTTGYEYSDTASYNDDGPPPIYPPYFPSDSLDDSIPEFPSDTAEHVLNLYLMNDNYSIINNVYHITGSLFSPILIEIGAYIHSFYIPYDHIDSLQWSSSYREVIIYEGVDSAGTYSGEVVFTDPLDVVTVTDTTTGTSHLTFSTSLFTPFDGDNITTIYCEYYDEDNIYHSDSLQFTASWE